MQRNLQTTNTLIGNYSFAADRFNQPENAVYFNNTFVYLENFDLIYLENYTIEFWVNFKSVNRNVPLLYLIATDTYNKTADTFIGLDGEMSLIVQVDGDIITKVDRPFNISTWHHLTFTLGRNLSVYIDGILRVSQPVPELRVKLKCIGCYNKPFEGNFNAVIDELYIDGDIDSNRFFLSK